MAAKEKKTVNAKGKTGKTAKKGTSGKTVKKAGGTDAEWKSLATELQSLIPQIDSEGLAFLVEQARVHLYNMQVEELNRAAQAANTAAARAAGVSRARETPKSAGEDLRINATESGNSYYLCYRNDNVIFSRDEMVHLVKMVNAEGTDLEIRDRLYNWFNRERKDIFALIPMADKFDNRLKALVALLKKNFKLRDG